MSKEKELSPDEKTDSQNEIKISSDIDKDSKPGTEDKNISGEKQEAASTTDIKETTEYKDLNDKYVRLIAEFDNFKKRSAKEYNRLVETAESNLILDLLHVVDDFSRALNHNTDDFETYKQGIEMISSKLSETLKRRGLQHMKVIDEEFDPNFHEAVMQLEVEDKDDGTIIEEVQAGYYLNDKVLRPAKVVVAKRKESNSGEDD